MRLSGGLGFCLRQRSREMPGTRPGVTNTRWLKSGAILPRRGLLDFVPKGLEDSAWGFNPRCRFKNAPALKGR
jgi:hypothetical protein